jgi:hypothetical protein
MSIIRPIANYSQISEARVFEVPNMSEWTLNTFEPLKMHFIQTIASGNEGLIIKSTVSTYRPGRRIDWLKVKPDYMRGLGDTGEYCIVGGSYDPKNTFLKLRLEDHRYLMNRFFIGVLLNKNAVKNGADSPHFRVLFTLETGFSTELLVQFCLGLERNRKRFEYGQTELPFKIDKDDHTPHMEFVFLNPQPVTLKGSSFEKRRSGPWVPRHPRLVQICTPDVDVSDTISYAELQKLGQESESLNTQETKELLEHLNDLDIERLSQLNLVGSETTSLSTSTTASLDDISIINDSAIHPEQCWVYCGKFEKVDQKNGIRSSIVYSPEALMVGSGWKCAMVCDLKPHRSGIVFSTPDECEDIIDAFQGRSQGSCLHQGSIYVVDATWIDTPSSIIPEAYILAIIRPFC